jgi:hypothetical protein
MDGKMDNKPSVLLIITQDTKEEEARFARAALEAAGCAWSISIPACGAPGRCRDHPKTWPPPA